ncbi:MAG: hypothetical protein ACXWQ5_00065 [Ktedonobacterales bacterium]
MHAVTKAPSPARDTLIFSLIQACDFLTTVIGITYLGTYEGNFFFSDAHGHPLWFRMVLAKLVICVLVYFALRFFAAIRYPHMYKLALRMCIAITGLTVVWNICIETYTSLHR